MKTNKPTIGFIGLGKMGFPMARHLLEAGYKVNAYDIAQDTARRIAALGAHLCNSIEEVGNESDCALLMVFPPEASSEVIFEHNLAKGMAQKARGAVIIDGGNADFRRSIGIARRLKSLGINYLDIGFSGGPPGAEAGNLTAYAGGDRKPFLQVRPILKAFCQKRNGVYYLGPSGSGHFSKVIGNNALEYAVMAADAELAALASSIGNPKNVMKAVNDGLAQNRLLEIYLKIPEDRIKQVGARIDVTQDASLLAMREAKQSEVGMPMMVAVHYIRKMSRELYDTGAISQETKSAFIKDLMEHLEMLEEENRKTGTVKSMAVQAALRNAFGGHKTYPPRPRGS